MLLDTLESSKVEMLGIWKLDEGQSGLDKAFDALKGAKHNVYIPDAAGQRWWWGPVASGKTVTAQNTIPASLSGRSQSSISVSLSISLLILIYGII